MPCNPYLRLVYPNELYHHGIKGQKWGVRRFQNPDGTLTSAGKKRYNKYTTAKKDYEVVRKNLDRYTKLTEEGDKKAAKQVLKEANKNFKNPLIVGLTTDRGGTYMLNDKLHSLKRKEIKYAKQLGMNPKYTKIMKSPLVAVGIDRKGVMADFEVFKDLKTDEERLNYLLYMRMRDLMSSNAGYGAGYGAGSSA